MIWENLAAAELEFYRNKDKNIQAINGRLQEIEETSYIFPVGYWDEDTGLYRKSGRSVEDQVIRKIELEKGVIALKNKLISRCSRIEFALSKLEKYEKEPIVSYYLDNNATEWNERKVTESTRALRKLYRFTIIQKMEKRQRVNKESLEDRKERAEKFRS